MKIDVKKELLRVEAQHDHRLSEKIVMALVFGRRSKEHQKAKASFERYEERRNFLRQIQ